MLNKLKRVTTRNREEGNTIVEVIVSMVILGGVLSAGGYAGMASIKTNNAAEQKVVANTIAEDAYWNTYELPFEKVRLQENTDDIVPDTFEGEVVIAGSYSDAVNNVSQVSRNGKDYNVEVFITRVTEGSVDNSNKGSQGSVKSIDGKDSGSPVLKRITVTVTYDETKARITGVKAPSPLECIPSQYRVDSNGETLNDDKAQECETERVE